MPEEQSTTAALTNAKGGRVKRGERFGLAMAGLGGLLALAVVVAVSVGTTGLRFTEAARALAGVTVSDEVRTIVFYRLGRVALAAIVGASLGAAGTALQALLRNPLADPYILGVSGGGALGAALYITFGSAALGAFGMAATGAGFSGLAAAAFVGSLAASAIVLWAGRKSGHILPGTLLLVGVMVNAVCGAAILALTYLSDIARSQDIVMWLMGNLGTLSLSTGGLITAAVAALVLTAALWLLGGRLNLMSLGDEEAAHLGVNVGRTRLAAFVASALVTGLSVALAGPIGFVGLVVPHIARVIVGADHRFLFPASAVFGAAFLVLADAAARAAALLPRTQSELPVGILTAALGGPFFIWLLRARRGRYFE